MSFYKRVNRAMLDEFAEDDMRIYVGKKKKMRKYISHTDTTVSYFDARRIFKTADINDVFIKFKIGGDA